MARQTPRQAEQLPLPAGTIKLIDVASVARRLRVRVGWIRRRIEEKILTVITSDGRPMLDEAEVEALSVSEDYWTYKDAEQHRSFQEPYVPDHLREYHRFHVTLNDFTWLLKAFYTPRHHLKKGIFRLDHLLQNYLRAVPPADRVARVMFPNASLDAEHVERASRSLKKVWYNELAYVTPQLRVPLLLDKKGVAVNLDAAGERMAFPSWRITQAYYLCYHASRALADLCGMSYRSAEHHAPMRAFKNEKLNPARRTVLRFPFDLAAGPKRQRFADLGYGSRLPHLRFQYAAHPRPPHRTFEETGQAFLDALHEGRGSDWSPKAHGEPYLLTDFLHQFRVWANYVDVENVVALKSAGFRAYLDLDLHTITFFVAAIVELVALARLGTERVVLLAEEFHHDFVKDDGSLWPTTALHPLNVRFTIYAHTKRLDGLRWAPILPAPPVAVELLPH